MTYNKKQPLVLISGFKAGTWLMRKVLYLLTDMQFFEPKILPGNRKYYDSKQLQFIENHFFSWHLVPTDEVIQKLNNNQAKTIFVVRNIYDLVLSIYYHFYNNIDADIGRGNNKDKFLKQFTFEEGISLIITGFDENGLRWNGMAEIIDHFNKIFLASLKCDNLLIDFDNLVDDNRHTLDKIANFLDLDISSEKLDSISNKTSFQSMKDEAIKKGVGELHFRKGKTGANKKTLSYYHKVQLKQIVKMVAPDFYLNADKVNCSNIYND